jgi:hypothetical protein
MALGLLCISETVGSRVDPDWSDLRSEKVLTAKGGARSSLHYGGEGVLIHPPAKGQVNLFGHVAVTQTLLPALIRSKGRVVNISSVGGKIAMATYGPYAGTKFALEAISDSLRREIPPFGVKVVVVEPGAVRTKMAARAIAIVHELASTMVGE